MNRGDSPATCRLGSPLVSDWQGPSNSQGLTLGSLYCAISRRLEGNGFGAALLLPAAHSTSVPSTPGPDIHRHQSRGHSPVPCCSHPGNFSHVHSESSRCFETYEEEKLDIKSRAGHLGVRLCFLAGPRHWGARWTGGEDREKNGKDRAAQETNLKISGLCGDSERKRKKRPSPWVSQQLAENCKTTSGSDRVGCVWGVLT